MRILMVPTLNAAVVYHRMEKFVKYLRRLKHEVAFSYWGNNFQKTCFWEHDMNKDFMRDINELTHKSQIVIFQSLHTQKAISLLMALQESYRRTFVSEYDDDIHSVHSSTPSFGSTGPGTNVELWGDEQIKQSNGVIVSTPYLKKIYSKNNAKIEVIPNCIDFEKWDCIKDYKNKGKRIKIGWEGGAGHSTNLRLIKNVMVHILNKYKNVDFHFKYGATQPDFLKHDRVIFDDHMKWVPVNEYPKMMKKAKFDIGIAPLRDLGFNRSKSNLRWLEYSALGIPTVASNVEAYKSIKHEETGFLVNEEDEWIEALSVLIENEKTRRRIGKNAHQFVRDNYNAKRIARQYASCLESFI